MTQKQINRLEMFKAVQTYMDNNTATWSTIPIVVALKNEFDTTVSALAQSAAQQEGARIFLGVDKTTQKQLVSKKADILNDALETYAILNENKELLKKAAKTYSDLYKLRNNEFDIAINETIALLVQHLANLADYGVTEGQITDLQNSMDIYLELSGKPRQYRIKEKNATQSLAELFAASGDLLNKKLDKMITRFKSTDPNFYNGYQAARIIVGI